jgi:Mg-chelatase subunit ChlD
MERLNIKIFPVFLITILITVAIVQIPTITAQNQDTVDLKISGSVINNYANLTYAYTFENTNEQAKEMVYYFKPSYGLVLNNVSISLSNGTLWGRVMEIRSAENLYNETVQQNLTGALIRYNEFSKDYEIRFNLAAKETGILSIYLEGAIKRNLGKYNLNLLGPMDYNSIISSITLDFTVVNQVSQLVAISISSLPGASYTSISHGYKISYTGQLPDSGISLNYIISEYSQGTKLIGYSNGSTNFFDYSLAPKIEEGDNIAKQIIFVIDKSGSMSGESMDLVKHAFESIIGSLQSEDYFTVVTFNDKIDTLWSNVKLANDENKLEAIKWVKNINPTGSTNIYDSIIEGFNTVQNNLVTQNIMFLLSDGNANHGTYIQSNEIAHNVKIRNTKEVSISTVAFGHYADEDLMATIANQNFGAFIKIDTNENAASELIRFYSSLMVPQIQDWTLNLNGSLAVNADLDDFNSIPLQDGAEIVITGTFQGEISITVEIEYTNETYVNTRHLNSLQTENQSSYIERLWALQRIFFLISQNSEDYHPEVLQIAIYYGLVIPGFTGMVLSELDHPLSYDDESGYLLGGGRMVAIGGEVFDDAKAVTFIGVFLGMVLFLLILPRFKRRLN